MSLRTWWQKMKQKPFGDVIRHKHRFVVMDTDTYKEKFSFQLSGINLFVTIGITMIVLILLTTILIAFTPLREYIPGYTNTEMVEQTYENAKRIDSLERAVDNQEWLVATMQAVLRGDKVGELYDSLRADSTTTMEHLATAYRHSMADSLLRMEVEREDGQYEVKRNQSAQVAAGNENGQMVTHLFFCPLKGVIITPYSAAKHHYGVDVSATTGSPVDAAYSGTVIFSGFVADEGHVIALQHPAGIITVYKNNSSLLKHQGDVVRAGEPIAYVGTSTNKEVGPHLHLELWVNGAAVDPEDYISF